MLKVLALAFLAQASPQHGPVLRVQSLKYTIPAGGGSLFIPKFNPALGTLLSVGVTASMNGHFQSFGENCMTDLSSWTWNPLAVVNVQIVPQPFSGNFLVDSGAVSWLGAYSIHDVPAFDGTLDYLGQSAFSGPIVPWFGGGQVAGFAGAQLTPWIGTGTVKMLASSWYFPSNYGQFNPSIGNPCMPPPGGGSNTVSHSVSAAGPVTLTYSYLPG